LDSEGRHGQRSVTMRRCHKLQKGPYTFVQAGVATSETGAEAVNLNPRCS